ncbi:MAG TPA: hypothetical protein VJ782_01565 [Aeromicrobium sp.]|nr:hypothetical protein [Aeromicrobium sp.]
MSVVGYSTLEVIPSVKGMRAQLEKQTSGDLAAAGKRGGKRFGDEAGREAATGFRSRLTSGLRGFNPLAGLAVGAGAVALFKDAIGGASDLAESTSKVNVVFGQASRSVLQFGADASSSLGQSEQQALSAAGTFGNLLRSVGLSEDIAAQFSTTMVKLASDLASFNNTSVDEALEALRAGLVGETEPLKKFGVNLNEAALQTEALNKGLTTGKGTLNANAKAQAAYSLIMKQTALAQGDFARTAGGLANQQKTLSAQWSEMTTELGQELLPAATAFVSFMNEDGIPALSAAGGAAKDAVAAFASIPGPVLAGAAAFGALRIASAAGLGTAAAAGAASVGSAMIGLRLRTMRAADAFNTARAASITLTGPLAGVSMGAGRAAASMAALRAASVGAGTAMSSGFGKVSAMVGGPWGAAFIAGTAILTKFYSQNEKVKSQIEAMKGTFEEQTGEFTAATAKQALGVIGDEWLKYAKDIGISMEDLTRAAVEGGPALDAFTEKYGDILRKDNSIESFTGQIRDANKVVEKSQIAFAATKEGVDGYVAGLKSSGDAADGAAAATGGTITSLAGYRAEISKVRTEIQKLADAEKKRSLTAIQNQRDALGLVMTLQATRKEAAEGARTLDITTEAGQQNKQALLELADQWSNSTAKVTDAKGAYGEMRRNFIDVATQMGATKLEAQKLADELLRVPPTAAVKFQSEGFKERLAEIDKLKAALRGMEVRVDLRRFRVAGAEGFATGGLIGGFGSGTSDSNLIRASRGEFMQRKAAVDYYGVDFMRRLNALQLPKLPGYAQGGLIGGAPVQQSAPVDAPPMFDFRGAVIQAPDPRAFLTYMQRRGAQSALDNVRGG